MKYFLDTEFIEGFHKPLFGKKRHFIDLISIGIVAEDGREYHAISNEYWYYKADDWVKKNVIIPLYLNTVHGDNRNRYDAQNFHFAYGKSNERIKIELLNFFSCWRDQHFWRAPSSETIEIYGYYADYDWVLICSLFGRMIDLPKGFPMYCRDLKQMLDEKASDINQLEFSKLLVKGTDWQVKGELSRSVLDINNYSLAAKIELMKTQPDYPKQTNEHNALADAKWNYELYKFLTK